MVIQPPSFQKPKDFSAYCQKFEDFNPKTHVICFKKDAKGEIIPDVIKKPWGWSWKGVRVITYCIHAFAHWYYSIPKAKEVGDFIQELFEKNKSHCLVVPQPRVSSYSKFLSDEKLQKIDGLFRSKEEVDTEGNTNLSSDAVDDFHALQKAVEKDPNNAKAHYKLAGNYSIGWGVAKDPVKAFAHYEAAAKNGHIKAMETVALNYQIGMGVTKNTKKGAEWELKLAQYYENEQVFGKAWGAYTKAAYFLNGTALLRVARCYEKGELGKKQEFARAIDYYEKAIKVGEDRAIEPLALLLEQNDQYVIGDVVVIEKIGNYYEVTKNDKKKAGEWYSKGAKHYEEIENKYHKQAEKFYQKAKDLGVVPEEKLKTPEINQ